MTLPDSNAERTANKYHVQINGSEGTVIGDGANVIQQFYHTSSESQVDLRAAEEAYRQKIVEMYKWLNFSGFDTPDLSLAHVSLEDIFVRSALTVERVVQKSASPEQSNPAMGREVQQRESVSIEYEPIELDQALGTHALIVGEPGAGKSTLLRWLAVMFAQGCQRDPHRVGPSADSDRLPILVELGRLPDRYVKPESGMIPDDWVQVLPEYITSQMAFTNIPPQLLTQALANGRCLLLFDGLDEVANRQVRDRLARSLVGLTRRFPGNRVIIGSRPVDVHMGESVLHPQFQRCQIKRFTPEDVRRFFHLWYTLDRSLTSQQQRDEADALYTRVQATPAILQLAGTPLLSTILLLIWRNEGNLPERRVDLYERCCRNLIEQWEIHHNVTYRGILADMDWEDHLHLLAPLAYAIHGQEQHTSVTREELVPLLVQALQTAGYTKEPAAASREAKQFLDALSIRSGLLQYIGDGQYGFPHQTFQEYLAARYIAAQPDPDYIDLVMEHLHEAWWQDVHLLTIAHLGSSRVDAGKASALILTILRVYAPPSRFLRHAWLGQFLPEAQLGRRIAWMLARELELAVRSYAECLPNEKMIKVETALSTQIASFMRHLVHDKVRRWKQASLLAVICQVEAGKKEVVKALLLAWHNIRVDIDTRKWLIVALGAVGVGNEEVARTLLQAWCDPDKHVRRTVVSALSQMGAGDEKVIRTVLLALSDPDRDMRQEAAEILAKVGTGNKEVARTLLQAWRDPDKHVRRTVVSALSQVGAGDEKVIRTVLLALSDPDRDMRQEAAEILAKVGTGNKEVVNSLLMALNDPDKYVRRTVASALFQVGAGNEVVRVLLLDLHKIDHNVRQWTIITLRGVRAENEEVVRELQLALHDPNKEVQQQAASTLAEIGVGDEKIVRMLLKAFGGTPRLDRYWVTRGLEKVGVGSKEVVRAMLLALRDPNWDVSYDAAKILGQVGIGDEEVVRAMLLALRDPKWSIQHSAVKILGRVGVGNKEVISAMLRELRGTDRGIRYSAIVILGQVGIGDEEVVRTMLLALRDPDRFVRQQAADILTRTEAGRAAIKDSHQLRYILVALNSYLHNFDSYKWGWKFAGVVVALVLLILLPLISLLLTLILSPALLAFTLYNMLLISLLGLLIIMLIMRSNSLSYLDRQMPFFSSLHRLLDGQPIPGYQWSPLRRRRVQRLWFKRATFWLGGIAIVIVISLVAVRLLGTLNPNGFIMRCLAIFAGITTLCTVAAQIIGRMLRDPWESP